MRKTMKSSESKGQARSGSEPPQRELLIIAERHPDESLLQIIERIDHLAWHTEDITEDQKILYGKVNGLTALRLVQSRLDKFEAYFALNAAPRRQQWLYTGAYLHLHQWVAPDLASDLSSFCDHLLSEVGTPPVKVFDHPDLVSRLDLPSIVRTVLKALPKPLPPSAKPVILKKRTLLRRTFPPHRLKFRQGNSNNQLWHQDSNVKYNDMPMLTLWIPLQDTLDGTRPGLDIIDAPAAYFSPVHGDYSADLPEYLSNFFPQARASTVLAAAGDCIVFNGLTFHQTCGSAKAAEHRDVLLIRVLDEASARDFSSNQSEADILPLG